MSETSSTSMDVEVKKIVNISATTDDAPGRVKTDDKLANQKDWRMVYLGSNKSLKYDRRMLSSRRIIKPKFRIFINKQEQMDTSV